MGGERGVEDGKGDYVHSTHTGTYVGKIAGEFCSALFWARINTSSVSRNASHGVVWSGMQGLEDGIWAINIGDDTTVIRFGMAGQNRLILQANRCQI